MHNYCKTIGALAAASALVAGNAQAEVEYELHTGYSSEYIFRGLDLGDNLTEVGVDVAGKWNNIGLSAGVWASAFDASATTSNQVDNEVDWYTEATYDFGFMTGGIGYIYYWNLGNLGEDSQEVYFSASHDFGFATASVTYFWGVDGPSNDGYSELALSRSFELNPCLTLNTSTNVGYLVEEGDFTAWTSKVSLDWGFAEHAKLSPFVALSIALGEGGNGSAWRQTGNEFSAGSMLSVSF
ncbi:MAG: TorF family putative porin [Luteolibacter sp.]